MKRYFVEISGRKTSWRFTSEGRAIQHAKRIANLQKGVAVVEESREGWSLTRRPVWPTVGEEELYIVFDTGAKQ